MKANIALVCAADSFNKEVGGKLAEKLDFYFMDVEDYLQFNMVDPQEIIQKCGVEYLNELRTKTIAEVSAYYDTVISIGLSLAMQDEHLEHLKKRCILVYMAVGETVLRKLASKERDENKKLEMETGLIAFATRDSRARKECDVIIDAKKMDVKNMLKKIEKEVGKKLMAAN